MPSIQYHKTKTNCFLYSVNSYLAHYINEKFYNGKHYVWCAPKFIENANPPSSNPRDIYLSLRKAIDGGDKHSAKISQIKLGLIKGAEIMYAGGGITEAQRDDILILINNAEIDLFLPLLYIIDKSKVIGRIKDVSRLKRASLLSEESLISDLHTDEFDIVSFECD